MSITVAPQTPASPDGTSLFLSLVAADLADRGVTSLHPLGLPPSSALELSSAMARLTPSPAQSAWAREVLDLHAQAGCEAITEALPGWPAS